MKDRLDDRRHGLEEEYRHRKEQEAIEKLRQKMKVAAEAKAASTSSMVCPRCNATLKEMEFEKVMIDTCEECGGVWLDSGELDQLMKKESEGFFSRLWFAEG